MSELHVPDRVQLELHPFYSYPDSADLLYARLGVATAVDLRGDALYVRAGVGDSKDHDKLAGKVDPDSDKNIALPSEMYAKQGIVTIWYYPNMGDRLEGLAGPMVKQGLNPEANLTREQTTQCLKMAALAIGLFVVQPPHEVLKQEDLSKIMVDETMLTEADRQFGRYITS
ncbi:hypothetical protein [Candidatus Nanosynbacter featherlites]|uniref:Uncharacterized protein n=1 Tax=Candidatus Nanosynbacter featherlites TaxID=2572088 RepID=A0A4P9A2R7_9BACT|nr:hypothetical protein [Candidatus Nanosynbacter featherlites]QCT42083.1 hypothetical protein FBF37_01165 [Candidatus Nanosynbacter featherlites]